MLYFLAIVLATFQIGRILHGKKVGLLSAFLVSMYPMIYQSSKQYALDLPLTAFVTLCFLFLFLCRNFSNKKYTIILGFSIGIGMMIKGQIVLFIIWPILFECYKMIKRKVAKEKSADIHSIIGIARSAEVINFCYMAIIAILIASIWWGDKIPHALASLLEHTASDLKFLESAHFTLDDSPYSPKLLLWHLRNLALSSIGLPLFILFCVAFIFYLKKSYRDTLYLWIIIPLILFSIFFHVKHGRFLMPILPPIAIISALFIMDIVNRKIKLSVLIIISIYCLTQLYYISFVASISPKEKKNIIYYAIGGADYGYAPVINDFQLSDVSKLLILNRDHEKKKMNIGMVNTKVTPGVFEQLYLLMLNNSNIKSISFTEMSFEFIEQLYSFDFIIYLPPNDSLLKWPAGKHFIKEFIKSHYIKYHVSYRNNQDFTIGLDKLSSAREYYKYVDEVKTLGSSWYIYKRNLESYGIKNNIKRF